MLIEPEELLAGFDAIVFDCRFSLADPQEGRRLYTQGHIPGAHYLDLNRDLAGPVGRHGGRHPLPDAPTFAALLGQYGVGPATDVVAYDDSRLAFAARLWWLMRALGYRPPRLLNGGYAGYLQAGGRPETHDPETRTREARSPETSAPPRLAAAVDAARKFRGYCDIDTVRAAQLDGTLLVDSREPRRYAGLEEPIDPVAGHIPGAVNRPWQGVTGADGRVLDIAGLQAHWGDALEAERLVVYCGSGVTACVNLFSLALLGREDATLYAGSWSDWCSYL
ncbi:MAG: sulfurtransferase [Haliea sp.]|nr:sulfurtransferase [Haliea sp.]